MIYSVSKLPHSLELFSDMLKQMNSEPEGAAVACVLALGILTENESSGTKALKLVNPEISQRMLQLAGRQLRPKPYLIRSYFLGTSPANDYSLPANLKLEITTNKHSGCREEGRIKLFLNCSGADTPRPITLVMQSDGIWLAHEWSTLIMGIRPPQSLQND